MKKLTTILFLFGFILNSLVAQDTVYVYQENGVIRIDDSESTPLFINPAQLSFRLVRNDFVLRDGISNQTYNVGDYTEIFKSDGSTFDNQADVIDYFTTILNRSRSDVAVQDQTTQAVIVNFNRIAESTTLAADRVVGDAFITVLDTLGAANNTYVAVFNPALNRFSVFNTLSISVDTLFLDTPLDVAYDSGSFVDLTAKNMAVDGSSSIQTFGLRGVSPSPVGITVDITRIIFTCTTESAVDLSTFADIEGGITNGLVLRKRDGEYYNIFNVKTNQDLAGLMYDWSVASATNPQQGQDGFTARLTFGGQSKIGVVIRLSPGEDLEFLVQDDLSSITSFLIVAEGHIVED